jgi:hypothetical protein
MTSQFPADPPIKMPKTTMADFVAEERGHLAAPVEAALTRLLNRSGCLFTPTCGRRDEPCISDERPDFELYCPRTDVATVQAFIDRATKAEA